MRSEAHLLGLCVRSSRFEANLAGHTDVWRTLRQASTTSSSRRTAALAALPGVPLQRGFLRAAVDPLSVSADSAGRPDDIFSAARSMAARARGFSVDSGGLAPLRESIELEDVGDSFGEVIASFNERANGVECRVAEDA
jgi:hypothetical protein